MFSCVTEVGCRVTRIRDVFNITKGARHLPEIGNKNRSHCSHAEKPGKWTFFVYIFLIFGLILVICEIDLICIFYCFCLESSYSIFRNYNSLRLLLADCLSVCLSSCPSVHHAVNVV